MRKDIWFYFFIILLPPLMLALVLFLTAGGGLEAGLAFLLMAGFLIAITRLAWRC